MNRDRSIAAAVTLVVCGLIVLFLMLGGFRFDVSQLALLQTPEAVDSLEKEEIFLEPEIIRELGEPNAVHNQEAAPAFNGEPEYSEVDNTKLVVPGRNPNPAPPVDKLVSTDKESPLKTTESSITNEERRKVTSSMAKGFTGRNGTTDGSSGTDGAGGQGIGKSGSANGRTFKGCPDPSVTLQQKTTVVVAVVIDSQGRVVSAKASGSASAEIRRACERAAMGARWSAKEDAPESRGSITFTIIPR